jgi:BirA family biotin operon repressor/biotin-[acetyl-CoA-carboxylase] ligase
MIIGSKIYRFDEVDSTNEYAKSLIEHAPEGTIVVADRQTAGKGRLNKSWYSPEGGLWMSVILYPPDASLISIIAGIAICETLVCHGVLAVIKWPNDILLNKKKIAGTLVEIVDTTVICGIGINLNIRSFPEELKEYASSVFLETKKHFGREMIYQTLCSELDYFYGLLKNKKISSILTKWRNYTTMLGRDVIIELPNKKMITGRVLDLTNDGALIIMLPTGKVERIIAGDCQLKLVE